MSTEAANSYLQSTDKKTFLEDVISGLTHGVNQKQLPFRYLYDERGCQLFEQICTLSEYYPTRTELGIMDRDAETMAQVCGEACMLIELGSGSSTKTKLLLDALTDPVMYVPVDIAPEYLRPSVQMLARRYPDLAIERRSVSCADVCNLANQLLISASDPERPPRLRRTRSHSMLRRHPMTDPLHLRR